MATRTVAEPRYPPSSYVSKERLGEVIEQLMEEAVFETLSDDDKGRVESIGDHLRTIGSVSPLQFRAIGKIYKQVTGEWM